MAAATKSVLIVGISGATGSGKTVLSKVLHRLLSSFPLIEVKVLNQDEFYYDVDDPNHRWLPLPFDYINWEVSSAFDNEKLLRRVKQLAEEGCDVSLSCLGEALETTLAVALASKEEDLQSWIAGGALPSGAGLLQGSGCDKSAVVILVEGILVFNFQPFHDVCDVRFFITLDKETCLKRRQKRSYDSPDPPTYFEHIVWPYYEKNLKELESKGSDLVYLDGTQPLNENLCKILRETLGIFYR